MLENSYAIAAVAAALLAAAIAAWSKRFRDPARQRLDGAVVETTGSVEIASRLLVWGAGMSALAAMVAVVGCVVRP